MDSTQYTTLERRLDSFTNWSNPFVNKQKLAEAGFFYKNYSDVVECPYCHIEGHNWVEGDDPLQDHKDWSPNCPYIISDRDDANIRAIDLPLSFQILPNSYPEDVEPSTYHQLTTADEALTSETSISESVLCKICYSKSIEVMIIPCGHLVCCMTCSSSCDKCPICRGVIRQKIRAYFS